MFPQGSGSRRGCSGWSFWTCCGFTARVCAVSFGGIAFLGYNYSFCWTNGLSLPQTLPLGAPTCSSHTELRTGQHLPAPPTPPPGLPVGAEICAPNPCPLLQAHSQEALCPRGLGSQLGASLSLGWVEIQSQTPWCPISQRAEKGLGQRLLYGGEDTGRGHLNPPTLRNPVNGSEWGGGVKHGAAPGSRVITNSPGICLDRLPA